MYFPFTATHPRQQIKPEQKTGEKETNRNYLEANKRYYSDKLITVHTNPYGFPALVAHETPESQRKYFASLPRHFRKKAQTYVPKEIFNSRR